MSTAAPVSPKDTPPVSPKITPSKDSKPPAAPKSETPQQAKSAPLVQEKTEKSLLETQKFTEEINVASKTSPNTCPLCKVPLNVGSKDSPNYNTCTECKNTVCNLCGFNPMPHTAVKEWLCLNCQTQRALSGALGGSGIMLQPTHAAAKPETQTIPTANMTEPKIAPIKVEPTTSATKQPVPIPTKTVEMPPSTKAKAEPETDKMETAESISSKQREPETTPTSISVKIPPSAAENLPCTSALEPLILEDEMQNTKLLGMTNVKSKDEIVVIDNATVISKLQEPKTESDAQTRTSPIPRSGDKSVPIAPSASKVAVSEVDPEKERKPKPPVPESIVAEVQASDQIKLKEPTHSLQQVQLPLKLQEQQLTKEAEPIMAAKSKDVVKTEENINNIISTQKSQQISTEDKLEDKDVRDEKSMNKRKISPSNEEVKMEKMDNAETKIKLSLRTEESDEDQPQILPVVQEVIEWHSGDASKKYINIDSTMAVEEKIKSERRRLSVQAMDESSESDLTPSSPLVKKKMLKVITVSSSSDDIKTESADSSIEEDDFIRKQILGMGDEKKMSVSEDEKDNYMANVEDLEKTTLDNDSIPDTFLSQEAETDIKDSTTIENVPETIPMTTFKKAIPAMRQRQSTDEEVESITESLSKGSTSVQASSITPGSSPTSVSSLEEDSDSSPHHRKVRGNKHHFKGRHKQSPHPLPTIENSSDEEKMKTHSELTSSSENASSTEDLKQVTVIDESHRTSGSEYSASVESDPEVRAAVQRGRKPSATVIPYTPADQFKENDTIPKSLKSAEEAYEEIIQKTKSIPGESPPDIEPLYGGMAIEDYLYESLVEDPEIKQSGFQEDEQIDSDSQSIKKLRSPEEVYEEMMQKKRELMMIEQEFQQAQTAMEYSSPGALGHMPPSEAETCVVTMSSEEAHIAGLSDTPPTGMDTLSEFPVKKKKRPAPPRPTEPPKRTVATVVPAIPSGSISFVRPMVPQDPALRKALFPIPDLKITQCSSGEEEDDSLADEYAIGISSDITPSDDSDTKDDPSLSPPLSETTEMEPICVVCEMPEPKPIPTPISAPELTTTPSTVSPVSVPTSPATPDSSLASNATSSSSFQPQTPLSSDSTPLSTPTPPMSFKDQVPSESSVQLSDPMSALQFSETLFPCPVSTTVIVTIPDLVSDPSKSQTTEDIKIKSSTAEAPILPLVEKSTAICVEVQMPDLVSSPSQVPNKVTGVLQVSAPSPVPVAVSSQHTAQVTTIPVMVTTPVSTTNVSFSVSLVSSPEPVIIQMPDLVSTTAPIVAQTPKPISALITTPAQPHAKVIHSIPVQSAIPLMKPVIVSAQAQTEQGPPLASTSTTVIKKKVPPPPPPRSTSVSLPEIPKEMPVAKTDDVSTKSVIKTKMASQPMQSVVVDIQPRMEINQSDSASVPQVVTQARQGHVVIIVPSVENIPPLGSRQTTHIVDSTGSKVDDHAYNTAHSILDIQKTSITSLPPKVSTVQVVSSPSFSPKPPEAANLAHFIPSADSSSLPPSILPKAAVHAKSSVSIPVTNATVTVAPVSVTHGLYQAFKPPPPIPPKPVSIPAGLVFSHKPGEHVKPPPPPVAPKAATLPRMKEPPKALSLSLTRPVDSKFGTTSPKSPLSPRHSKSLQTYVVITLPSEPGSPTETVTVQAPIRQGSIPSSKVSKAQTTQAEQKTPTEPFSVQATVRRASVPSVKHPPPITVASTLAVEYVTTSEEVATNIQPRRDSFMFAVKPPLPVADVITVSSDQGTPIQAHSVAPSFKKLHIEQQQSMFQPSPETVSQVIKMPLEQKAYIQPHTDQTITKEQSMSFVPEQPSIVPEAESVHSTILPEVFPQALKPISPLQKELLTEIVVVPQQPELLLDVVVVQGRPTSVHSAVLQQEDPSQIEIVQEEQNKPTHVLVTDTVPKKSSESNLQPLTDHKVTTQIGQDTKVMPIVKEDISTQQAICVPEGVTFSTKADYFTELFTVETGVRVPEVAVVSPVPHPPTIVDEITPTPQLSQVLPIPRVAEMATHATTETTPALHVMEDQQMEKHPDVTYFPQEYWINASSVMSAPSLPSLEIKALQLEHETPTEFITMDSNEGRHPIFPSELHHQTTTGISVTTTDDTECRRRTSSSTEHQPYSKSDLLTYPAEYEMPLQEVTTEACAASRKESITITQPLSFAQILKMPAEKDVPTNDYVAQVSYESKYIPSTEQQPHISSYSSEYDYPVEILTTEEYRRRTSMSSAKDNTQGVSIAPVTFTKIQQESIESQEVRGTEKVVSSMSHMYSSISTSGQTPESLSSLVTQVVTTEVQRTTVSVVHERLPQVHPQSVAITIQPDIAKVQPLPKENVTLVDVKVLQCNLK
ncbi:protein piccolo [Nematolebias whitei]|uniref:protein piccolo n=1 Tax=Nematolebias whitei TaxID=451745 RepID=UPI00189906BE|nr:protein piccolo [Nematolebias whitei]